MATWLYKRRNRVSPSTRPTPDFVIDEPGSPVPASTLRDREEESKSSWPWKKKSKSKNGGSDPGKVDPFPFDYTPLAVDSLSPPSQYHQQHGHHGQYYDPYVVGSMSRLTLQQDESDAEQRRRERHEQRRHERRERRTRSSSETRPLQGGSYGRVSGETVRPSTASGSGGLRPQASSATLGVPPGYTSSPLLYPGSRSLAGTPVPGSQPPFGTVTPYLSPSTPIPSSSTPRPGGRSPVPPPSPRHSPNPRSGNSPVPPPGHPPHVSSHLSPPPSGRPHNHTHTFEVQLSPEEYAELRRRYPELPVRRRKHRHRDRDQTLAPGQTRDDDPNEDDRRGRRRSWSAPIPPVDPFDEDGRPRTGPELAEKYRPRARRRRETDAGKHLAGEIVRVVQPERERRRTGEPPRALDGGVSLLGGPPPTIR
ncbi:hypothetical protein RhiLY_12810 [Ceratobasidium sp. AG-Ba]|nr:hypothetical protein RhiLY_12810 [Ceratobasidium sp. AG-Ba]